MERKHIEITSLVWRSLSSSSLSSEGHNKCHQQDNKQHIGQIVYFLSYLREQYNNTVSLKATVNISDSPAPLGLKATALA
jgi:hypothetical protein